MFKARRRRFLLTSAASLALAASLLSPAVAEAGKDKSKGKAKAKIERLCQEIGCSASQKTDIAQVFKQMHMDIKPDREAIRDLRKQLATEWKQAKPDERKLARIADKIAAHERNIADRRMEAMLELHPMLSPEQREVMADHLMKGPRGRKAKAKAKSK